MGIKLSKTSKKSEPLPPINVQENPDFRYNDDSWPDVMNELTRVLKPGGYLELVEFSAPLQTGPVTSQLFNAVNKMLELRGLDILTVYKVRSYFEQQENLEDIIEEKNRLPHGPEAGKLGQATAENCRLVLSNLKPLLQEALKISSEELKNNLDISAKELREFNSYQDISCVYARKIVNH
ncbi:6245_t:CDS:2 [Diversispora eburnea]|uniref:6245_t:CDS:1 n=1 Tax=Diversispora eburnea TaxID=1213867 RepID=A0A9N8ZKU6_9GLOM|nr:6245_t:CDS:2 [Diversispora eburnea]